MQLENLSLESLALSGRKIPAANVRGPVPKISIVIALLLDATPPANALKVEFRRYRDYLQVSVDIYDSPILHSIAGVTERAFSFVDAVPMETSMENEISS